MNALKLKGNIDIHPIICIMVSLWPISYNLLNIIHEARRHLKVLTCECEPIVEKPGVPDVGLRPQAEHVVVKVLNLL